MPNPAILFVAEHLPTGLASADDLDLRHSPADEALRRLSTERFAAVAVPAQGSGLAFARRLRQAGIGLALFFLLDADPDAGAEAFDIDAALALGAVDFLGLPLGPALLRAKLRQLAHRPAMPAEEAVPLPARAVWQAMLAGIGEAVIASDAGGRIVFVNPQAEQLTGWPRAEALGRTLGEVFQVEDAPPAVDALHRLPAAAALAAPKILVARNGSRLPSCEVVTPITDEEGRVIGSVTVFRDLSRRHAAAEMLLETHAALERRVAERTAELSRERAFLSAVLDGVEDGVVACNADGVLTVFNRASRRFHGLSEQPLPAERWSEHYRLLRVDGCTPLPKEEIPLFRALSGERVRGAEMVIAGPDGQRTLRAVGQPLHDASGKLLGAVVSMHDISVGREMRAAREAAIREQVRREAAESAAEILSQSRESFELLLESSGEGIYGMAEDGRCTFINRAGARMLGLEADEVVGRQMHSMIHHHRADGSPYPAAECRIEQAVRQGLVLRVDDEVFWHRDGHAVPVAYTVHPAVYRGRQVGAVINFSDVTERRRAEERLRASEERVRLATDAADLGIWVWNFNEDHVIWENDRVHVIFGVSPDEEPINAARFMAEFVHPEDAAEFQEQTTRSVATGERMRLEVRFYRRDGELRWAEFTGLMRGAAGEPGARMLGTVSDITDRKLADLQLRAQEERYATLFASMDEGFCIIESLFDEAGEPSDYRFLEYNCAFELHTGMKDVVGRTVRELYPDFDMHWVRTYGRVAKTGESVRLQDESTALNRWFDVYATRLGGPGSHRVACLFNDITERRRAEADLRRLAQDLAEQDRRKTEFLATLAHELRNPLAPLRNGLHLMARAASGADADAERFGRAREMMERQLVQLVRLVDDLLDIARITRGKVELKRERVALQSVVDSAVETATPLMDAARHGLSLDLPAQPLLLDADPVRMAQVIGNLLNNAAKYTPRGGRISLAAHRDGAEVVVAVRDNGIGIPLESLGSVFDMFTQVGRNMDRAQGGLGIGLTLVRRLVELHGGTVSAHSAGAGSGSEFIVRLPLVAAASPSAPAADVASQAAPAGLGVRILVADDNIDAAESMAGLLEMSGHVTRVAHDGFQAIRVALEFRPDVAFLDIGMPGKTGYEVARALRSSPGLDGILLVALTGWGTEEDRAQSSAAGFDRHLTKPAELEAIEQLLQEITATAERPRPRFAG